MNNFWLNFHTKASRLSYIRVMPHSHTLTARDSTAWTISRPLGLRLCVGACATGPHTRLLLLQLHT